MVSIFIFFCFPSSLDFKNHMRSLLSTIRTPVNAMQSNTLMLTGVLSFLPASRHLSLMCSAGSHGYHALKEMMHNGKPGNTLLLESDNNTYNNIGDAESIGSCSLVYTFHPGSTLSAFKAEQVLRRKEPYSEHIPPTVTHIHAYWDTPMPPMCLLDGCSNLTTIDLHPLSPVTQLRG